MHAKARSLPAFSVKRMITRSPTARDASDVEIFVRRKWPLSPTTVPAALGSMSAIAVELTAASGSPRGRVSAGLYWVNRVPELTPFRGGLPAEVLSAFGVRRGDSPAAPWHTPCKRDPGNPCSPLRIGERLRRSRGSSVRG